MEVHLLHETVVLLTAYSEMVWKRNKGNVIWLVVLVSSSRLLSCRMRFGVCSTIWRIALRTWVGAVPLLMQIPQQDVCLFGCNCLLGRMIDRGKVHGRAFWTCLARVSLVPREVALVMWRQPLQQLGLCTSFFWSRLHFGEKEEIAQHEILDSRRRLQ